MLRLEFNHSQGNQARNAWIEQIWMQVMSILNTELGYLFVFEFSMQFSHRFAMIKYDTDGNLIVMGTNLIVMGTSSHVCRKREAWIPMQFSVSQHNVESMEHWDSFC